MSPSEKFDSLRDRMYGAKHEDERYDRLEFCLFGASLPNTVGNFIGIVKGKTFS